MHCAPTERRCSNRSSATHGLRGGVEARRRAHAWPLSRSLQSLLQSTIVACFVRGGAARPSPVRQTKPNNTSRPMPRSLSGQCSICTMSLHQKQWRRSTLVPNVHYISIQSTLGALLGDISATPPAHAQAALNSFRRLDLPGSHLGVLNPTPIGQSFNDLVQIHQNDPRGCITRPHV